MGPILNQLLQDDSWCDEMTATSVRLQWRNWFLQSETARTKLDNAWAVKSFLYDTYLVCVCDGVSVAFYQPICCHLTNIFVVAGLWKQETNMSIHILDIFNESESVCTVWGVCTWMKQLSRLPLDKAAVRDLQRTRGVREDTSTEYAMPPVKSSIPSEMLPPFRLP